MNLLSKEPAQGFSSTAVSHMLKHDSAELVENTELMKFCLCCNSEHRATHCAELQPEAAFW